MRLLQHLLVLSLVTIVYQQITFEECKRDCTLDWIDCVHGCESIGNPQYCHQNCQKVVHGCLDECPRIVCIDKCRAGLEDCRKLGKGICELSFNECEAICEETYSNNEEL